MHHKHHNITNEFFKLQWTLIFHSNTLVPSFISPARPSRELVEDMGLTCGYARAAAAIPATTWCRRVSCLGKRDWSGTRTELERTRTERLPRTAASLRREVEGCCFRQARGWGT